MYQSCPSTCQRFTASSSSTPSVFFTRKHRISLCLNDHIETYKPKEGTYDLVATRDISLQNKFHTEGMESIEITTLEDENEIKIVLAESKERKPARKWWSYWSSCSKQLKKLMKRDHSGLACEKLRMFWEEAKEEKARPGTIESSLFAAKKKLRLLKIFRGWH